MTAWRHLGLVHATVVVMGRLVTMVTITTTDRDIINKELLNPENEGNKSFRNLRTTTAWFCR
jgi:hypothetical protein